MYFLRRFLLLIISFYGYKTFAQTNDTPVIRLENEVARLMKEGDIPGLSLVIVDSKGTTIKNFGYADLASGVPVTSGTLFEIGSCSKAFTALAVLHLAEQSKIDLNKPVSAYLPWFTVLYENETAEILVTHLLHHTSGLPWHTLDLIPPGTEPDALELVARKLIGYELANQPGKNYEYASINYDILGLILEKVSGKQFEDVLRDDVFASLGMNHSSFLTKQDDPKMAKGYKQGFFRPIEYAAPFYRGNMPSGYAVSNAEDMAAWLRAQLGQNVNSLTSSILQSHMRDETAAPHGLYSYAKGWDVSLRGDREISHAGLNPNFSCFVTFYPKDNLGVAVLANAGSNYTPEIGKRVVQLVKGIEDNKKSQPDAGYDKIFSIIAILLSLYSFFLLSYFFYMVIGVFKSWRKPEKINTGKVMAVVSASLLVFLGLTALYFIPYTLASLSWPTAIVWSPVSFMFAIYIAAGAIVLSYLLFVITTFLPEQNKYKRLIPKIVLISILSGISNMVVILLITTSLYSKAYVGYLVFYYGIALVTYIIGRRFVQINLIKLSRDLVSELRVSILEKVSKTNYQNFEKLDTGKIYTTINDDIATVGNSTNVFVSLVTNLITVTFSFLYLATIAYWANLLTIGIIILISAMYYVVSKRSQKYFIQAAESRNVFMKLLNGLIDGFKEISLHRLKKHEYKHDIIESANDYRNKIAFANIKFVNTFLIGESLLIIVLGSVAFAFPTLFPDIETHVLMGFIIILLYLIGPFNSILNGIPTIMELKVAWNRVQNFLEQIPANEQSNDDKLPALSTYRNVTNLQVSDVHFYYKGEKNSFGVGPINIELTSGDILFITGGNGSGKSTVAKILTGLYNPDQGEITIDSKVVHSSELSEYYTAVFSPATLFEKIYEVKIDEHGEEVDKYLELLQLKDKVEIRNNRFSSINLSSGQRKRLALLQCYLENRGIFLFDEWAADQDPEFRRFFYTKLLPDIKARGKIIIAITHDDHYFHVATKIIKMNFGKVEDMLVNEDEMKTLV